MRLVVNNDRSRLGIAPAIGAAVGAYAAQKGQDKNKNKNNQSGGGGSSSGGGGGRRGSTPPGGISPAATAISPTFQQQFTPQISPAIQISTGESSGPMVADIRQIAPGGQEARGGSATATAIPAGVGPSGTPYLPTVANAGPGPSYVSRPPSGFNEHFLTPSRTPEILQAGMPGINWNLLLGGGLVIAGLVAYMQFRNKKRS